MKAQAQSLPPCNRLAVTPQLKWSFNPTLNAYRLGTSTTNGWLTYLSPSPPRSNNLTRYRNINLLSIDYAFRPRLRIRLTLGGFTVPRKPWVCGEQDSHLLCRYLFRDNHF